MDDAGFPVLLAALSTTRADRPEIVQLLLMRGGDPNQCGVNDWTPLHWAACHGGSEAVEVLLKHGSDPKLRIRIDNCETPEAEARRVWFTDVSGDSPASALGAHFPARGGRAGLGSAPSGEMSSDEDELTSIKVQSRLQG